MKFIDLFAGIGGFRLGMEAAGHDCVAFCEIDKFARASYKAIHNTEGETELHDITAVTDEQWRKFRGAVDVICGGFPCQAFSIAGKRKGFLDETRGTLFFEIARAAKQIKPRTLLLENVKGLLNHDKGNTFRTILSTLDELGYDAEWQVLNSKNFGVPQNRDRVFIVGHLRGAGGREVFPFRGDDTTFNNKRIQKVGNIRKMGRSQSGDVFDKRGLAPTLCSTTTMKDPPKIITGQPIKVDGKRQVNYKLSDTVGTLLASQHKNGDTQPKVVIPVSSPERGEKRQNGRRFKSDGEDMFTLTAQDRHGVAVVINPLKGKTRNGWHFEQQIFGIEGVARTLKAGGGSGNIPKIIQKARGFNKGGEHGMAPTLSSNSWQENNLLKSGLRIRKLAPCECWRLQGFPDWAFDKAQEVNSNSQLYKQAGNSVTVNVVFEIANRLE